MTEMTKQFAKTLQQLQEHLDYKGATVNTQLGFEIKRPVAMLVCNDGTTASVQASETHYCSPRTNTGPYYEVEVWCVSCPRVTEFNYDSEEPSGYVPIEKVVQFIINHGGFKE